MLGRMGKAGLGGAVLAAAILLSAPARADGWSFDEVFRHWGDADHMGMRGGLGVAGLRTLEAPSEQVVASAFVALWGQGVAFSYYPDTPRSFRFAGYGSLGVATTGERTSFDGTLSGEAMIGYRLVLPAAARAKRRKWPRSELVARVGFGFHLLGNHALYSSALELPRFEVGFRHDGWHGGRQRNNYYDRDSYSFEVRAVTALLTTGQFELTNYQRALDLAPAWGGQIDVIGERPELSLSYLRAFVERKLPIDRLETRVCLKLGEKKGAHHPYLACGQSRLQYAVEADGSEPEAFSLSARNEPARGQHDHPHRGRRGRHRPASPAGSLRRAPGQIGGHATLDGPPRKGRPKRCAGADHRRVGHRQRAGCSRITRAGQAAGWPFCHG